MNNELDELKGLALLGNARDRLFGLIRRALEGGSHHKWYEGRILLRMPEYFSGDRPEWAIDVACYVFGPHRDYIFTHKTLTGAVALFNEAMDEWEKELAEANDDLD